MTATADGGLTIHTRHCRLSRADARAVMSAAMRATPHEQPQSDLTPYAAPFPTGRYAISLMRKQQAPVLLLFAPMEEPVRPGPIRFNGALRYMSSQDMTMMLDVVARAGCATWTQRGGAMT